MIEITQITQEVNLTVEETTNVVNLEVVETSTPVNIEVASIGFQGLKGDKGDIGEQGLQGEQGIQGIQGVAGTNGIDGEKGDKGDTGATGLQGLKGDKGDKGETGDVGAQGIQGIQGVKGDTGNTGAQGIQGIKGDKGDVGDTGAQGIQGIQGIQGVKGDTGIQGIQGIQGLQGIQGEKGDKGDAGDIIIPSSDVLSKQKLTTTDLSTNSGFTDTENGVSGGTVGTENFTVAFPTIDYTKKFRVDIVLKIKDASTANARIEVLKSGNSWQGLSYIEFGGGNLVMNKTHLNSQGYSNVPSNSTFQYSLIGNGKRVVRNIIPLSSKWDGSYSTTYLPSFTGQIVSQSEVYNYNPSGEVEMFKDINLINVTGANTSQVIIESINVQYFDNPSIYDHKPYLATLMDISILNDSLDDVYPSFLYCPPNSKGLVQWHHPNGYNGTIDSTTYGMFFPDLFNDGYAICYGTFNSYNNPLGTSLWGAGVTSSNWGAPTGLVYRKALNDYVDSLINADYFIQIGGSMGAFNALSYAANYPDKIRNVIGISGALDLTYNYNNGFSSVINKAYGAAYRCIAPTTGNATSNATYWVKIANEKNSPSLSEFAHPFYDTYSSGKPYIVGDVVFENYTGVVAGLAQFDLILNPRTVSKIPILLIHGISDSTISYAQSSDFKTAVNAINGDVNLTLVSGANHLDISLFDYNNYVKEFLTNNGVFAETSTGLTQQQIEGLI